MSYIIIGALSFVVAGLFEVCSLKRVPRLKQAVGLAVAVLFTVALLGVSLHPDKVPLPTWTLFVAWPLAFLAVGLLVYSMFLEIPFRPTYVIDGAGEQLVTTGTYALVRHPGILWLGLFLVAALLVSRSRLMLIAAPIWFLLDVFYVWVEERFYFYRMFPGYWAYQQTTPMLLPTRASIRRCWQTLGHRGRNA